MGSPVKLAMSVMDIKSAKLSIQVQQMFASNQNSLITGFCLAAILAYMQWDLINHEVIIAWLLLLQFIQVIRIILVNSYRRDSLVDDAVMRIRLKKFRLGVVAAGVLWGSAAFLMFPADQAQHQMFVIYMLTGLTAGGVVSYSADLFSGIAFPLCVVVPLIVRLLISADAVSLAMAISAILYLIFIVISLRQINRNLVENISLRFDADAREEDLEESREKFRGLSEAAFEAILISENGLCLEQNSRAREMFGYGPEEAVGKFVAEWIVPEDRNLVVQNVISGNEFNYEVTGRRKDGSTFPASLRERMMSFKGRAVRVTSIKDISDRKQAELALQQQLRFADGLNAIAKRVVVQDDPIRILDDVIHVISEMLATDRALIYDISFSKHQAIGLCEWLNAEHPEILPTKATYSLDLFINGATEVRRTQRCLSSQQGEINPHLLSDGSGDILHQQMKIRSLLWYPFAFREDGYFMLALNQMYDSKTWGKEEISFLDSASQLVSVALEKIRLMNEGKHLEFYDPLTQLPNRRLLVDRLQQALASSSRNGSKGALLFLDLDHFKVINDTLGHYIGDRLLQQVAQRLSSCVREGDTVARLGGDEFVVLLEDLSADTLESAEQTEDIGETILANLSQPYQFDEHEYLSTLSIGVTLFSGHQQTTDDLLKQADIAMYQSKKSGRNTLRFFDPDMQSTINTRAELEDDLRAALVKQQFQLHYQVQVDSHSRAIGAEALIRWIHPARGMVSPLDFIPLAEETGLILPIGAWVLQTACAQLRLWQENEHAGNLTLAVNVSAKQFHHPNFVAQVRQTLLESGANPARLKLEITESMMLENVDEIIAKMKELKLLGMQFSMDDFGTGYSSLQYIKRLPLDQLKIDRSFVRDITSNVDDASIVQAIVAMSQALRLDVIAEGVETEMQRTLLEKYGCNIYQGYFFSKPVAIQQFEELIRQY
jgi:diguanylate cyclase (GGDEF)-like protein/PAS domain S-box-containing protein